MVLQIIIYADSRAAHIGRSANIYGRLPKMGRFSTGLFAGAVIGMGIAMLDKRSVKRAKRMARSMAHSLHGLHC